MIRYRQTLIFEYALLAFFVASLPQRTLGQPHITTGKLVIEMDRLINKPPKTSLNLPLLADTTGDGSGKLYFPEKEGRIQIFDNGSYSTFLEIEPDVQKAGSRGLLGLSFHPDYNDSQSPGYHKLYTFHSSDDLNRTPEFTGPGSSIAHHNVITEWKADANNPDIVDISTRREILREGHTHQAHSGGMIDFGPDGYLYASFGTPPSALTAGQDPSNIFGTILRIDPIDPILTATSPNAISTNGQYRIPTTNPFVGDPIGLDEVYAYGVRNIYRFSIDPITEIIFGGDVGQGSREEVNAITIGDNLGWPSREGTIEGPTNPLPPNPEMVEPIADYTHDDGRSVIGGYIYRGSIPELQGKYIFGEFSYGSGSFGDSQGRLFWLDPYDVGGDLKDSADIDIKEFAFGDVTCDLFSDSCAFPMTLYAFGTDDDEELYIVGTRANKSVVYKIVSAFEAPNGDYDRDGIVTAADYTLWQDTLGSSTDLLADGNNSGDVDQADYLIWQDNFNASAVGSSTMETQVPEPANIYLLVTTALGLTFVRKLG